ncbi:MAG: glucose 1-dehydrogenase [Aggregatilineales bacterium]
MQQDFMNKVALITGGSSGIGQATALGFARRGAKVVVAARHLEGCMQTVEMIRADGGEAIAIQTDVSRAVEVEQMIQGAVSTYGRLDFAFNNAATLGKMAPLAELEEPDFDQVISTNLKGVWLCMKYEIRAMLPNGRGCIVNNSSLSGILATPHGSFYNASKHGMLGLTKCAAVEYVQSGLRINAICPGSFPTPMLRDFIGHDAQTSEEFVSRQNAFMSTIPAGRFGKLDEVAQVVLWLCSDSASFVIGQAIIVDGGATLM